MAVSIYWVGDGQLLVTMKNGIPEKIKSGQEIKPEYLSDGKTPGIGLSAEFIAAHMANGNISENPLAGKKVSGNKFLENKVVEQQRRIEELEKLVAGNFSQPVPADAPKAAGKKAAAQADAPQVDTVKDSEVIPPVSPEPEKKGIIGKVFG